MDLKMKTRIPRTAEGSVMNIVAEKAHKNAVQHGIYEEHENLMKYLLEENPAEGAAIVGRDFVLAQLAKIMGEGGEAVSAIQHGNYDAMCIELADIVIRVFDLAGYLHIPIGDIILYKMKLNTKRPYKHGKEC